MAILHEATITPRKDELHVRRADGTEVVRDAVVTARGAGAPDVPAHDPATPVTVTDGDDRTTVAAGDLTLTVLRRLGRAPDGPALLGSFEGGADLTLAVVDRWSPSSEREEGARCRRGADVGEHETIAADADLSVVNQEPPKRRAARQAYGT
ncbi:hypothetical protein J2X46_002242 [Nocardioides sp. BE266]|uniref:hypothetical protein n=1 Tax=Nocardioides sp. BE266 TaxID=2817725 RepID=UPI002856320B|nr:hypothetical protein [Nocardioides sp. BE266]MDR7253257.1 hypothetical protein [Nocardioides sp. BE266]